MVFMMFYFPKFFYIGNEVVPKVLGECEVKRQRTTKSFIDYFLYVFMCHL